MNLAQLLLDLYSKGHITIDKDGNGHASEEALCAIWVQIQNTGAFSILAHHHNEKVQGE